jgi:hypothetical protein
MDTKYYELHVTVLPAQVLEFATFCASIQAKPLYIQLSSGERADQLMLAATNMLHSDEEAVAWATQYGQMVEKHFPVLRVKLESRLTEGPNEYYEAHWKLDFKHDPHYWDCELQNFLVFRPQLLRSRNLFDTRIHYLSQRIYNSTDHLEASRVFNASGIDINFSGLPLVKTHYERAVWDSNLALDDGWAR